MNSLILIGTLLFVDFTGYVPENLKTVQGDTVQRATYVVLWKLEPEPEDRHRNYVYMIRLDMRLNLDDFKHIICRFIKEQKLQNYTRLQLEFYYRLDEYIPPIGNPPGLAEKQQEHFLGSYRWSQFWALKEGGGTITLRRDKSGERLPKDINFSFDHLQVCKD